MNGLIDINDNSATGVISEQQSELSEMHDNTTTTGTGEMGIDDDDDDDDFGDFEEEGDHDFGEFTEQVPIQENTNENQSISSGSGRFSPFNSNSTNAGILDLQQNMETSKEQINLILNDIFKNSHFPTHSEQESKFHLSERCGTVFDRLTQEPRNLKQINWKKSLIKRQLFVSLQIPIDLDELKPVANKKKSVSKIYDQASTKGAVDNEILNMVPHFDTLKIDNKEKILKETNRTLEEYFKKLQPFAYYNSLPKDELQKKESELNGIKDELLQLVSCWNKKEDELKSDNLIFSSYVENLVGNTQKMRRNLDRV
ncbi:unnamed protein product [Ambrosiozyma monospora]|uniref:Unnamed protein product n=1 Tax=Ambrosiozyma monospora TaxID=43982 RepID=A0ACB5T3I5_AMBMO|nr:unnamed protein product [Ambrosiozyma monospora]